MKKLLVLFATIALTCSCLESQTKIVREGGTEKDAQLPDDMFDLPELATIIAFKDGKLVADNVFDKKMRPKEYESIDIKQGDVIMMVNGKRVKSLQELRNAYTSAAIGSAVKLGIERNTETAIVSFDKADPEKMPKRRIMINKGDGHDLMIVPGAGLVVGSKGKEVVVEDILSDVPSTLTNADVKKGDVLTAVNETKVTSFKEFSDAFKKIGVGDKTTFHTTRKGKQLSFSFTKAEGGQQHIIKRSN